ncbi:MAG: hypothetical protein KatS3mg124_0756 [Porticoccaceae bacterium]|nr:MAG: hypothetical protein KatS3mg124_0756 [Porticoccaceae bacterium]
MPGPTPHLAAKLRWARRATWASLLLLGGAVAAAGITARISPVLWTAALLPLLLLVPGTARESARSLVFLSFVSLLYFVPLVAEVGEPDAALPEWLALFAACSLFLSATLHARWVQRRRAGSGAH